MFVYSSYKSALRNKTSYQVIVPVEGGYALMSHLHYCIFKQDGIPDIDVEEMDKLTDTYLSGVTHATQVIRGLLHGTITTI